MSKPKVISIDGDDYVLKSDLQQAAVQLNGMPYVVVRSATASPFAGYLESTTETTAVLVQARRIRQWHGAMDLNQLATEGTKQPDKCLFGVPSIRTEIPFNEIHYATETGAVSIQGVKEWKS